MTTPEKMRAGRGMRALSVLVGLVSLVAGLLALLWPGVTLAAFALVFGVATLVTGVVALVEAVAGATSIGRGVSAGVGLLGIVVGLVALRWPAGTLLALVLVAGIWLVVYGLATVLLAGARGGGGTAVRAILGIVDVILGVLVVAWPAIGLSTLAFLVGVALCVRGTGLMVIGWSRAGVVGDAGGPPLEASSPVTRPEGAPIVGTPRSTSV